ncbi:DUF4118 domain-containing protein [Sphingomonas sp. NFR04]|uniref:DUF4118 domain-containing protein n=1 Tax=Sphingomonas sp. NFR04 TaxID=1566283 RepID=UPI0011143276|nr:DUF4118 domain-containing protein [Sphingomonas sp. NFR04]
MLPDERQVVGGGFAMSARPSAVDTRAYHAGGVGMLTVAISGSPHSEWLVEQAEALAARLGVPWEALHVETPRADRDSPRGQRAAVALATAARLGATIARVPAASAADGIQAHLRTMPIRHLVLGHAAEGRRTWFRGPGTADRLLADEEGLAIHRFTHAREESRGRLNGAARPAASVPVRHYLLSAAAVALTLVIAGLLQAFVGLRPLDLLFLFPVIAVAARLGLGPALLAVALAVLGYNYFLMRPLNAFSLQAPLNVVMGAVLGAVAIYTSTITARLRGRLVLSDRSAHENASIAALAQKLTRDADWETTARTVCEHVHRLFDVQATMYREVDGVICHVASIPSETRLGPVNQAALDWAWAEGEAAGVGTAVLGAADWQFHPLKTSLGTLAVLGIARDDGRDPVNAVQKLLLHTLIAQAALAHERLRLEDRMRGSSRA